MKGLIIYTFLALVAALFLFAGKPVAATAVTVLALCWFLWDLWCVRETGRQRGALIDAIADAMRAEGYQTDYWPALDSVTFDRHLWLLTTFRNPWKEYVGLPPGFSEWLA